MPKGTNNSTIPGCGFHHISIQTPDFEAALRFYRDGLGMSEHVKFEIGGRRFVLLDCGDGSYLELQEPDPSADALSGRATLAHFALAVSDLPSALDKARLAGCEITMQPKQVNLGGNLPAMVAFFTGPNGESVELFQEM
jgi:glyoxylase I family protein